MKTRSASKVVPSLLLCLALLGPAALRAADRTYLILAVRPAAAGTELLLRSLQADEAGKNYKLALRADETLIDLGAAAAIPPARARGGDILFISGSGAARRLMVITPGQRVNAKLAAGQPEEAGAIDELSRRVAAQGATEPAVSPPAAVPAELDRVRRSFLFVLEFALGAPFTAGQEQLILDSFGPGWWSAKSEKERKAFARYPQIVAWILQARQEELEEMRASLETTTRQWLDESPPGDAVVAVVRGRLLERGKVLFPGEPPLTEMAASAFAELYAFAELLQQDDGALPEQTPADAIAGVRYDLLRAWSGFSPAQREQVATAPGLWLVLRTLLLNGDTAQRHATRERLAGLVRNTSARPQPRTGKGPGGDVNRLIMNNMLTHSMMMNMQQQTFNSYMWSRGFSYQPATGKMW